MEDVSTLIEANPEYSLYTTGHSLGGALSTLFAFEVAANDRILKPVTCITIASPKVGNLAFRRAFQVRFCNGAEFLP
jgi:triacylglycerol lipase